MPFRDNRDESTDRIYEDDNNVDVPPFAKKRQSARDKKRALEAKIRTSMSTLQHDSPGNNNKTNNISPEIQSYASYQSTPNLFHQQSGQRSQELHEAARISTSYYDDDKFKYQANQSNTNSSKPQHSNSFFTDSPLPSSPFHTHHQTTNETIGSIVHGLFECVGAAIRLGASEIVTQPTALYHSMMMMSGNGEEPQRNFIPSVSQQTPSFSYQSAKLTPQCDDNRYNSHHPQNSSQNSHQQQRLPESMSSPSTPLNPTVTTSVRNNNNFGGRAGYYGYQDGF